MITLSAHKKVFNLSTLVPLEFLDIGVVHISISAGSQVEIIDDLHEVSSLETEIRVFLAQDAYLLYRCSVRTVRDKLFTKVLFFELVGIAAKIDVFCAIEGRKSEMYTLKTVQHHHAYATESNVIVHSVLHDGAQLSCNTVIRIEKSAQRSRAIEQNRNLLIGENVRVTTIPTLEVEVDDVSVVHGAAMSGIDDAHLFYLQSRGLSPCNSQKLLIHAFLFSI